MKYMGSKNRIAKYIVPIMLNEASKHGISTWVEPFVGGANTIDKVPDRFTKYGYDLNPHTISALIGIRDCVNNLPLEITEEYYNSIRDSKPDKINSLILFGASFGGKFNAGFARGKTNTGVSRDYWKETIRNAKKQSPKIQGLEFQVADYRTLSFENSLIYCDPPYKGTSGYKTGNFDHNEFFSWCVKQKELGNVVFVSEYDAPFEEVWRGEIKTNFASSRKAATHTAIEKLYKV